MKKQNNNKTYGLGKEREVKKMELEGNAMWVSRSRGSFGAFDVESYTKDFVKLISVKSTKQKYASYTKELKHLASIDVPTYCRKYLYIYWSPRADRELSGWQKIRVM